MIFVLILYLLASILGLMCLQQHLVVRSSKNNKVVVAGATVLLAAGAFLVYSPLRLPLAETIAAALTIIVAGMLIFYKKDRPLVERTNAFGSACLGAGLITVGVWKLHALANELDIVPHLSPAELMALSDPAPSALTVLMLLFTLITGALVLSSACSIVGGMGNKVNSAIMLHHNRIKLYSLIAILLLSLYLMFISGALSMAVYYIVLLFALAYGAAVPLTVDRPFLPLLLYGLLVLAGTGVVFAGLLCSTFVLLVPGLLLGIMGFLQLKAGLKSLPLTRAVLLRSIMPVL